MSAVNNISELRLSARDGRRLLALRPPPDLRMQVLLPGDPLPSTSSASAAALHLGPGLQSSLPVPGANGKGKAREDVLAVKAGLLGFHHDDKADKWWLEGQARRVRPNHGVFLGARSAAAAVTTGRRNARTRRTESD